MCSLEGKKNFRTLFFYERTWKKGTFPGIKAEKVDFSFFLRRKLLPSGIKVKVFTKTIYFFLRKHPIETDSLQRILSKKSNHQSTDQEKIILLSLKRNNLHRNSLNLANTFYSPSCKNLEQKKLQKRSAHVQNERAQKQQLQKTST